MVRSALLCLPAALASLPLIAACAPVQQLQSVAAAGGALANSVTGTGEQAALTAGELRQLQTRDFEITKAAAFASVMAVLLDSGYRVVSADLQSGLVTATASSTGRLRLDATGLSKTSQTPLASVYVEERGADRARVRIVFSLGSSASGQLATAGERVILDPSVYGTFFARLQEEVEQRPIPRQPFQTDQAVRAQDADATLPNEAATSASAPSSEHDETEEGPEPEEQIAPE